MLPRETISVPDVNDPDVLSSGPIGIVERLPSVAVTGHHHSHSGLMAGASGHHEHHQHSSQFPPTPVGLDHVSPSAASALLAYRDEVENWESQRDSEVAARIYMRHQKATYVTHKLLATFFGVTPSAIQRAIRAIEDGRPVGKRGAPPGQRVAKRSNSDSPVLGLVHNAEQGGILPASAAPFPMYASYGPPELLVKLNHPHARVPTRGSELSAGLDLTACEDAEIPPRGRALVDTGLCMQLPANYYGRVAPRSGLAARLGLDVGAGVIDEDYRGSVKVLLFNHSDSVIVIRAGQAIAQLIVTPYCQGLCREIPHDQDLPDTVRGSGGFGSTDMHMHAPTAPPPSVPVPTPTASSHHGVAGLPGLPPPDNSVSSGSLVLASHSVPTPDPDPVQTEMPRLSLEP
jgi:dUTP pyrophosphatase